MLPQIALFFGPEFPDLAAQRYLLDAIDRDVRQRVVGWTVGRLPHCDFRSDAPTISRVHVTIYYDRSLQGWFVVDGGEYPDDKKHSSFSPSHNGVWLNRRRIDPGDPEVLGVGSRLLLGPDLRHKIVVGASLEHTFTKDPWAPEDWPEVKPKEMTIPSEVRHNLQQQALEKSYPNSLPGVITYGLDVLAKASIPRLLIYAVIIAAIAVLVVVLLR